MYRILVVEDDEVIAKQSGSIYRAGIMKSLQ